MFNIQGAKYRINYSSGSLAFSKELETVSVIRGKADWIDWGKRMNSRFGNSLGYSFGGYGQSGDVNWYGPAGQANWFLGVAGTALENTAGSFRLGTPKLGFSPKYYGNAWRGNQYATTYNIGKIGGAIGKVSFGLAFVMDGVGLYNYYRNPNYSNVVSPGKFAVNTGIGLYSLKVSPALGIVYFGVDAFYPGGWLGEGTNPWAIIDQSRLIDANNQIVPGLNLSNDARGGW